MKSTRIQNLLFPLFLSTTMFGCSEAMDQQEWPDAEFGIESADEKDDSFAIRPGSREADAVLAYVNQPLRNQAEGDGFLDAIDNRIDKRAARAIAKYRAGADTQYGTDDDGRFLTLESLDALSYVGRTALMRLFELAEAAGYFNNASVDCADYLVPSSQNSRGKTYRFTSYASLLELENSKCEMVRGDVIVQLSSTDLLPPAHRMLTTLRHLKSVEGNLTVETTGNMTGAQFEKLESVTGTLLLRDANKSGVHTFQFPSLTNADRIQIFHVGSAEFAALKNSAYIELHMRNLTGFKALETAGALAIYGLINDNTVSFPRLSEVVDFRMTRDDNYIPSALTTYKGSFESLVSAGAVSLQHGTFADLSMPVLSQIEGDLTVNFATEPLKGLSALQSVGNNVLIRNNLYTEAHVGPVKLERVEGSITIEEKFPVKGYDLMTYVGGTIHVDSRGGIVGFGKIEQTFGNITLITRPLNQTNLGLDAFHSLVDSRSISMDFAHADGPRKGFARLKEVSGNLTIQNNRGDSQPLVFTSLESILGTLMIHRYNATTDLFPALEIINGALSIDMASKIVGFEKLAHVEMNLRLLGADFFTLPGLKALRAVGGDIEISRSLDAVERDSLLDQLTEFSGNIFLR